jgi:hypothetical protein
MKKWILLCGLLAVASSFAELPPLSDEARAKAEEAKAKAAWSTKVSAFQLCKVQDKIVARFAKTKDAAANLPPCVDPGPYVATVAPVATETAIAPVNVEPKK